MSVSMETQYAQRLNRYVTAMRNEKPDRVPIRVFAAEFTSKYAGYSCQQVTHDYQQAFAAARKTAADFGWDATVGNMVYVWTGLTQAIGLRYYGIPGIHVPADTGFQYREPSEDDAYMRADEYDQLIADPTGFLLNTWLPRVSADVQPIGAPSTLRNNLSFLKGGMAMLAYFMGFGTQAAQLRTESGTVGAISGIFKAPLDIIADKLRGYLGLTMDLLEQPEKVMAACEALMPHLLHVALSGADPNKHVPVGFWMHRGCVPFVTESQFHQFYWPTLRPIIERIWESGHQTLFYAEGNWDHHLSSFAELPDRSIVYHVDRGDVAKVHKALGHKFCISGGIPNYLLAFGAPDEVRDACKRVIDIAAPDGGYVMDASAIIQNDAQVENVRAMTEFTQEYGVYGNAPSTEPPVPPADDAPKITPFGTIPPANVKPGVCVPWEVKRQELPAALENEDLLQRIWEENEGWAYLYAWQCLLSF